MTNEPSPRPWRVNGHSIEANDPDGLWLQNEKTGWGVVANLPSCPKSRMSKRNRETWDAIVEANARLIVDAVNERDRLAADEARYRTDNVRLRDIVRRLLAIAEPAVSELKEFDAAVLSVGGASVLPVAEREAVIREARAAIGEANP